MSTSQNHSSAKPLQFSWCTCSKHPEHYSDLVTHQQELWVCYIRDGVLMLPLTQWHGFSAILFVVDFVFVLYNPNYFVKLLKILVKDKSMCACLRCRCAFLCIKFRVHITRLLLLGLCQALVF